MEVLKFEQAKSFRLIGSNFMARFSNSRPDLLFNHSDSGEKILLKNNNR